MALIYVLEDDAMVARTLKAIVKSLGHECHCFLDGAALLPDLNRVLPDLMIVDMWLGDSTGIDFVVEQAGILGKTPVVLISGGGGELPLETVTAIADVKGFVDVLYKPFTTNDLAKVFDTIFSR